MQIDLHESERRLIIKSLRTLCGECHQIRLIATREYSDDAKILNEILWAVDDELNHVRRLIARISGTDSLESLLLGKKATPVT